MDSIHSVTGFLPAPVPQVQVDKSGEVEYEGKSIAEEGSFGGVGESGPERALQAAASLGSSTALGGRSCYRGDEIKI